MCLLCNDRQSSVLLVSKPVCACACVQACNFHMLVSDRRERVCPGVP